MAVGKEITIEDPGLGFNALAGKVCWGVAAGAGTGSVVSLHFGAKVLRRRVNRNSMLAPDLRRYEGEYILFIECDWILSYKGKRICDSNSANVEDGEMVRGLDRLVGATVKEVAETIPSERLTLLFSSDLALVVDPNSNEPDQDNYTLFSPEGALIVGSDRHARFETSPDR